MLCNFWNFWISKSIILAGTVPVNSRREVFIDRHNKFRMKLTKLYCTRLKQYYSLYSWHTGINWSGGGMLASGRVLDTHWTRCMRRTVEVYTKWWIPWYNFLNRGSQSVSGVYVEEWGDLFYGLIAKWQEIVTIQPQLSLHLVNISIVLP